MNEVPHPTESKTGRQPPIQHGLTLAECIRGKGLPGATVFAMVLVLAAQVGIEFRAARSRPAPPTVSRWYPAGLDNQTQDVIGWVDTGLLLPRSAVPVRAPRPLFPFIVTLSKWMGLFSSLPPADRPAILHRGIRILLASNLFFSVASGWLFLAACRRFGFSPGSALCASVLALSGRGFSYWSSQAIPEVLTYFASIACLSAGLAAVEAGALSSSAPAGATRWRRGKAVAVWSLVGSLVGIFLLGKEIYWLVLMGVMWLAIRRAWAPLAGFLLGSLAPTAAWLYYVVRVIRVFNPADYYSQYGFVTWLFTDILPAPAAEKIELIGSNFNQQVGAFLVAFVWIPAFLCLLGIALRRSPGARVFLVIFFLSQYGMFLAAHLVRARLMFWTWPVTYFFAWTAVEWISEKAARESRFLRWSARVAILGFLVWLQTLPFTGLDFF